jgi:L-ascorbate metabolism protein UlaG (beta-lactamase superfamily)
MDLLAVEEQRRSNLLPLLSRDPAPPMDRWEGPGIRVRYCGHACVLVECGGASIMVDPCIGVRPSEGGIERFTYSDLPPQIDYLLITHGHQDHFNIETLLRLRRRVNRLVVPRSFGILYGDLSLRLMAKRLGFKDVVEVDTLDSIPLPNGEIVPIPFMGEHADLAHGKTAYVVRFGRQQILFAADSDCLDSSMYSHIRNILGPIQTVFIGMECVGAPLSWSCGPFLPSKPEYEHENSRRYKGCDSERALDILEMVDADRLYIYAMGLEPWLEHLLGLAYSEDALQIKEARRLLKRTREAGFLESMLLFGRKDIHLSVDSVCYTPASKRTSALANQEFAFE